MSHLPERLLHYGKFKIQSLLVGLLALTLIGSTTILTVVSLQRQNETLTKTKLQNNFEAARNLAISANTLNSIMFQELGGTARYMIDEQLSIDAKLTRVLGSLLMSSKIFNDVLLFDRHGKVLVSTPDTSFTVGDRLGASVERSFTGSEMDPWMSAPFVAPNGHRAVLAIHPMKAGDSSTVVYIAGLIDLQRSNVFSDMFKHTIKSDPGTFAYLVDGSGQLIMSAEEDRSGEVVPAEILLATFHKENTIHRSDAPERQNGPGAQIAPAGMREHPAPGSQQDSAVLGGQREPMRNSNSNGIQRAAILADGHGVQSFVGYLQVGDLEWGVVVQSPVANLNKAKRELLTAQLKWSVPLILAFLLLSLWSARKLAAPFSRLTAVARSIAAGDRAGRPPFESHWNYEAHHLARAMMTAVQGLQSQADKLSLQAHTDHLTGLLNRSGLDEWLKANESKGIGYALLVIDIDHFKSVNDKYGHQIGDETLVHLARILKTECKETDLVCRLGGEEFVVILPGESRGGGFMLADKVRGRVEYTISPTGRPITVSIGVAYCQEHGENFEKTFQRADEALYEAKRSGRNRAIASA